jgi:glycosyltransferase involved in cell wall biosynthesis
MGRAINPIADIRAYFELLAIVRRYRPEVIHSHTFKAGLLARLLPTRAKRIHTFHGHLFEDSSFSPFAKALISSAEKFLAMRTDVLVSVGERVGAELRAIGIGKNGEWRSIAPGVDPLPGHARESARAALALPDQMRDWLLVGWMARVTAVKNPGLLLQIARAMPQVQFVMAGGGDLLAHIKAEAPGNLLVLGWAQADQFWSAVDIALSTSDNEGMPVALIEAQLAALPVIATDVGANGEVILDGESGLLAKSGDLAGLVAALERLVASSGLRMAMGESAKSHAQAEFAPSLMISRHLAIYR